MKITLETKYVVEEHCCNLMAAALQSEMIHVCVQEMGKTTPCIAAKTRVKFGSWHPFKYCPYCGKGMEIDNE